MDQPFIGQIQAFGFNFAPRGWMLCNGQIVSIAQYTALFALIGTFYGGDGHSTFQLPDLRGRVPIGFGQQPGHNNYVIGQAAGIEAVTLTLAQMPQHNHSFTSSGAGGGIKVSSLPGTTPTPSATENTLAALNDPMVSATNNAYNNETPDIALNTGGSGGGGGTVGFAGGSQAFSIVQPYLSINYSIAMVGIFPSRN